MKIPKKNLKREFSQGRLVLYGVLLGLSFTIFLCGCFMTHLHFILLGLFAAIAEVICIISQVYDNNKYIASLKDTKKDGE